MKDAIEVDGRIGEPRWRGRADRRGLPQETRRVGGITDAGEDIKAGRVKTFDSVEEVISDLEK